MQKPAAGQSLAFSFDNTVPRERRAGLLRERTGDLKHFQVGEIEVELEFTAGAPKLQTLFEEFLLRGRRGLS